MLEKPVRGDEINSAIIWQCDEKRSFFLNQRDKIYNSSVIEDRSELLKKARPVSVPQMSGAEVTITIDSVDTGERRQFEHYATRHVKFKTTFEPGPGASPPASVEETEGWYIDLPGLRCEQQPSRGSLLYSAASAIEETAFRSNDSANPTRLSH